MKNNSTMLLIIFTVVFLSFTIVIQLASAHHNDITEGTKFLPPLSVVSTRNTTGDLIVNVTEQANFTIDKFGGSCPSEIAIYIHGFNREETEAGEELNRIQTSLNYNNYRTPLVGFSWDSKTGWETAKNNAKENGPKLAQFIIDFKNKCPNTNIRLIAHSLGAAVVNSTLVSLDTNPTLRDSSSNNSKIIKSVHLLAAAINNQLIAKNTAFGNATEHLVEMFYNLYDIEDDGLEFNKKFEKHNPLGLVGASSEMDVPENYNETNVAYEIPPISDADGDGNVEECFEKNKPVLVRGDNHCGYIGFREPFLPSLIDDGAMDVLVRDWIKS